MAANFEETKHYGGEATVKFYPGMHGYFVDDPKHPEGPKKNARTGGGTSLTGNMAKGQGLMMWPMWEMSKYLRSFFESTPFKDIVDDPDYTIDNILKAGRDAHVKKSDRGKSVGTDAHSWVELYSNTLMLAQQKEAKFIVPEVPEVEEIQKILRSTYLRVINDLKPKELEDFKRLPKLIFKEIEIQEALWTEATMTRQSIQGAKAWLEKHEIIVHGAEQTVYSRSMFICGKYDADWTVTCTAKCGWCYRNGNEDLPAQDFTGRYIVDFKSSNASNESPKGIYSEYLAQCGVYDAAITEEFPDRHYDGHLILNGSKVPFVDKKGEEHPLFNTHFSMDRERNMAWAKCLVDLKRFMWEANKEVKEIADGSKAKKAPNS